MILFQSAAYILTPSEHPPIKAVFPYLYWSKSVAFNTSGPSVFCYVYFVNMIGETLVK